MLKSLLAVQERIFSQANSFEVFGYDIMFDSNLKPFLIEVNSSPSMQCVRGFVSPGRIAFSWLFWQDYPLDYEVKEAMIEDTIRLGRSPASLRETSNNTVLCSQSRTI